MVLRRRRRTKVDPAEPVEAAPVDSDETTPRPRDRTRTSPRRRFRSLTPRRWLPFLAFVAIVVFAIAVDRDDGSQPTTRPVETPGRMMPVAAPSDALSTAFFCPGGSALGEDGPAELSVVIANAGAVGADADIDLVTADGTRERVQTSVPAYGMTRIDATDHIEGEWVSVTVDVLGGDLSVQQEVVGADSGRDLAPCPTATSDEWFVPAGSTAIGAEEHLLVYNPFPAPAVISLAFTTGGSTSSPRPLQGVTIEGRSLHVFTGEDLPARRDEVATHLTTRTGQVVFGRVQTFDGDGEPFEAVREAPEVAAPEGLAATPAVPVTSARWIFPTIVNAPTVRNALAIHNPGDAVAEINLVLGYEDRNVNAEIEPIQVTVRPGELQTVDLRDRPGLDDSIPYTIVLDSFSSNRSAGTPVVAELQVFGGVRNPGLDGGELDDLGHDHDDDETAPEDGETPPEDDETPPGDEEAPPEDTDDIGETSPEERDEDDETATGSVEEQIVGYATITGSPVSAGRWIVPDVNRPEGGSVSVTVHNPASTPVRVEIDIVANGVREPGGRFELDAGDTRAVEMPDRDEPFTVLVTADEAGVVVGQSLLGETRGVAATIASPLPGTVRTLPPPKLD